VGGPSHLESIVAVSSRHAFLNVVYCKQQSGVHMVWFEHLPNYVWIQVNEYSQFTVTEISLACADAREYAMYPLRTRMALFGTQHSFFHNYATL
jgi:hypothetical protein